MWIHSETHRSHDTNIQTFELIFVFKQVQSRVFASYCVIFSSSVVGLTKCINSRFPLLMILQLISVEKNKSYVHKVNVFIDGERKIFFKLITQHLRRT